MDAHFNEYLAAVAGMAEVYGVADDGVAVTGGPLTGGLCSETNAAGSAVGEQFVRME